MSISSPPFSQLLLALRFAAQKHRDQRRKGSEASPFINHPIEVAELLARVGGVGDLVTLQAAVLHDVLEDTDTGEDELEAQFGRAVSSLVVEVTDDKRLSREERKELQVVHAPSLSSRARLIKLADKICNVRAIALAPPVGWSVQRRSDYLDWTERVIAGCRGCNAALEAMYDRELEAARRSLAMEEAV